MNKNIYAVLNGEKMPRFCEHYGIDINDLDVNFEGWGKVALLTKDTVFLFPRTPNGAKRMEGEIEIYQFLSQCNLPFVPKLKDILDDHAISYYKCLALERVHGSLLGSFLPQMSDEQVSTLLTQTASSVALYHECDTSHLPDVCRKEPDIEDIGSFLMDFINQKDIQTLLKKLEKNVSTVLSDLYNLFSDEIAYEHGVTILSEIQKLKPVLVHYDLHEGQIVADEQDPTKLRGIIDWESARLSHPVLDFNFFQWDLPIFDRTDQFATLREQMWKTYAKERGLQLSSPHGLHLLYTLAEFQLILEQKEKDVIPITGKGFGESVEMYKEKMIKLNILLRKSL
jgi:Ser/Thr protein kinase RdoA (MazF antagonist)